MLASGLYLKKGVFLTPGNVCRTTICSYAKTIKLWLKKEMEFTNYLPGMG